MLLMNENKKCLCNKAKSYDAAGGPDFDVQLSVHIRIFLFSCHYIIDCVFARNKRYGPTDCQLMWGSFQSSRLLSTCNS